MTSDNNDTKVTADAGATPATTPAEDFAPEPEWQWTPRRQPKPGSKTYQLIRLLSGKTGADVVVLCRKLGWQVHTTRAAITGLRKSGYPISHEKGANGKPGRYRITGPNDRVDG